MKKWNKYDNSFNMYEMQMLDKNDDLLIKAYKMDNIKVVDLNTDSQVCYIFFSDNSLYWPNYRDIFEEKIINNNYFEWEKICQSKKIQKKCSRIIFVRDIWKNWYIRGVNCNVNSVDKLLEKIRTLSNGYRITTIGNSAGGYMATLAGIKLGASSVYNFSGQYVLHKEFSPLVGEMIEKEYKYANLVNLITSRKDVIIYYFLPVDSVEDWQQFKEIEGLENVKTFHFNSKEHGHTMFSENMPIILGKDRKEMDTLYLRCKNGLISKWTFLLWSADNLLEILLIVLKRLRKSLIRHFYMYINLVSRWLLTILHKNYL